MGKALAVTTMLALTLVTLGLLVRSHLSTPVPGTPALAAAAPESSPTPSPIPVVEPTPPTVVDVAPTPRSAATAKPAVAVAAAEPSCAGDGWPPPAYCWTRFGLVNCPARTSDPSHNREAGVACVTTTREVAVYVCPVGYCTPTGPPRTVLSTGMYLVVLTNSRPEAPDGTIVVAGVHWYFIAAGPGWVPVDSIRFL